MLKKIRDLKRVEKVLNLNKFDLNTSIRLLKYKKFIDNFSLDYLHFSDDLLVSVIRDTQTLLDLIPVANSCLTKYYSDSKRLKYLDNVLHDKGSIYFSIDTGFYKGYFRFYVAKDLISKKSVLFEDVLHVGSKKQSLVSYKQEFKSVVLKTLKVFGVNDGLIKVPFKNTSYSGSYYNLKKLGSHNFKKRFSSSFYSGKLDGSKIPSFEQVSQLI